MSETKGRCRQQLEAWFANNISSVPGYSWMIADAIDRLAADVATIKATVCDGSVAEERDRFLAGMGSAIKQRDKARRQRDEARAKVESLRESIGAANRLFGAEQAKVERLRKELEQRQPAGNSPEIPGSSPSAPPPAGVSDEQVAMDKDRAAVQRYCAAPQPAAPAAGWLTDRERMAVAYFAQVCRDDLVPDEWTDSAGVLRSLLARAGSPPVVEVPHLPSNFYARSEAELYRVAISKAGVAWKEVGRE